MNWAPVRGLQPAALALARRLAAGEAVAHGRALHRDRVRDLLLHRPLLRVAAGSCAGSRRARPTDSFVWRRPLVSLALLLFVVGFVIDAILEIFLVRTGLYIYSQVIPWGSLFAGTTFQFPLIWESALVTAVMIPAGVLCYRDDTGRTQAEKLAQRLRWFPHPSGPRHVPGDVRHPERRLFRVRRRLRSHPRIEARDRRRLPLAVSRKPRSTTRRGSTSERGNPAPTSRATGTPG